MATEHALFTAALGLSAPWEVSDPWVSTCLTTQAAEKPV